MNSPSFQWIHASIVCVALAVTPIVARADEATASASLSDTTTDVGQPVEYQININGARGGDTPQAPDVDGLTITGHGRSTSTQITGALGGGMHIVSTTTYTFSVEASRPGRFVIPGQQINTGSGTVSVGPVTLTVSSGGSAAAGSNDATRAVLARLTLARKSAYVGEVFEANVKAYFGASVAFQAEPNVVLSGEGFTAQKFTVPQQSSVETLADAQYRVLTYKTAISGAKIGSLSVGPAEIGAIVQMPQNRPRRRQNLANPFDDDSFFRDPFGSFTQTVQKQVKLRAEPQTLDIKALPSGAPPDFSGAVGQFTLEAEAEPRKAQSGDPVTVKLHLSGRGNFDRVNAPTLQDTAGLHTYPATAKFKADDTLGLKGTKNFEQTIVAQGGRKSLPGYHFSYFDPETEKYVTLTTPPLAVTIEGAAAPTPTPEPSAALAPTAPSATPAPTPPPKARDILYIRTDAGSPADFAPVYRRKSFWIVQGIVAALLAGLGVIAWRRAQARNETRLREAEAQRRQAELLKALRTEGTARRDFYSAAARFAQLKAGSALGKPGAHLTPAEICAVEGSNPQKAAFLEQIFDRHDELAYSGGAVAQEPVPPDERRAVLETLETFAK